MFSFQKSVLPPRFWSVSISKSCLFASLGMVITRFWWWKLPPSCRLPLVSSALFCPLLSYSLFFGKPSGFLRGSASYYYCRTGYKLLQERSPAILSRHGKTRASSVLRMAYRKRCYTLYLLFLLFSLLCRLHRNNANNPDTLFSDELFFPFSCDRFFDCLPLFFFSTCVFVKKIPSNRGEALFLMYHFRSQFCGLKTGKWGLRDLFLPHFLRLLSAIISTMLSNIEVKVK